MKKSLVIFTTSLVSLLTVQPVFAACFVNEQEIPCSQFQSQFGWIFVVMGIVAVVFSAFWLWMLVDCIKRDFSNKTIWILLIIFTGILGAVLYFFLVRRKQTQLPMQQSQVQQNPPSIQTPPQSLS